MKISPIKAEEDEEESLIVVDLQDLSNAQSALQTALTAAAIW
jgi:hypothetical protein